MGTKNKDFMTSREAATQLGVALSTVQLWANNGLLRAWTTGGGHRRIARSSVESMLTQQRLAISDEPETSETETLDASQDKQFTVVIVEDMPEQRKLYKQQFAARKLPVRLILARNGFEGLIQIGRYAPDVIITDLMMPNMDGFQMIKAFKEESDLRDTLTIAVTALGKSEVKAKGGLPDDVAIFTKPIPFDELENVIRQQISETEKIA